MFKLRERLVEVLPLALQAWALVLRQVVVALLLVEVVAAIEVVRAIAIPETPVEGAEEHMQAVEAVEAVEVV
jgi:hypothetical protein